MRFLIQFSLTLLLSGLAFSAPSDIYTDTATSSGTYGGDLVPNNPWYTALLNATDSTRVDSLFVGAGSNPSTPYYYVYPCTRATNPYSASMTQNCSLADLWVSISQNSGIGGGMIYGKQIYNLNAMLNNPNGGYQALRWINWFEWRCNMTIIAQGNWWGFSSWLTTWAQYALNQYPGKGINQSSNMQILDPSYRTDPDTDYNNYTAPWFYPYSLFGWGWNYSPGTMDPPNGGANFKKVSGRTMPQYNANYSRFYYKLFMLPTNVNYSQDARNSASVANQATVQYNTNDPNRLIITRAVGAPFYFYCETDASFPSGSDYRAWFYSYGQGAFRYLSPNYYRYSQDYPSMMSSSTRYSSAYPNFSYMGTLTSDNGANGQFVEIPLTFLTVNGNSYRRNGGTQIPQTSLQPDASTNSKNPTAFRLTVMNYDTASGSNPATLDRLLQTASGKLTPRGWQNLMQPATGGGASPIDLSSVMGGLLPPSLKTAAFLSNDNQFLCTLVAMSLPQPFQPNSNGPSFPTLVVAQVTLNQSNINPNATASGSASGSSSTSSSSSNSSSSSSSSSTSSGFSGSASNSSSASSSASASSSSSASSSASTSSGDSSSSSNSASISISSSQSASDSSSTSNGESSSSANSASISISSSLSASSSTSDSSSSSTSSGTSSSASNSQSTSLSSSISTSGGDGSASSSASQGDSSSSSISTSTSSGASNSVSTTLSSSRSTTSSTSTGDETAESTANEKEKDKSSIEGGNGSAKPPEKSEQDERSDPKSLRPFTLSAATLDEKSVRLAWLYPQSDATGFEIERLDRHDPKSTWEKIAHVSNRESNYLDTKLPKDFDFLYRISAKTIKGSEVISQEAPAKPYAVAPQLEGEKSGNGFRLTWKIENVPVKQWKIESAASSLGPWNVIATVSGDQTTYLHDSSIRGYYRVAGILSGGTTLYSQRIPSFSSPKKPINSNKP